jgi:hypothetical protein
MRGDALGHIRLGHLELGQFVLSDDGTAIDIGDHAANPLPISARAVIGAAGDPAQEQDRVIVAPPGRGRVVGAGPDSIARPEAEEAQAVSDWARDGIWFDG